MNEYVGSSIFVGTKSRGGMLIMNLRNHLHLLVLLKYDHIVPTAFIILGSGGASIETRYFACHME